MRTLPLPPPAPVAWSPGLVGEYPGQESVIELGAGSKRVPMRFCWCPPAGQVDGFWLAKHPVSQARGGR